MEYKLILPLILHNKCQSKKEILCLRLTESLNALTLLCPYIKQQDQGQYVRTYNMGCNFWVSEKRRCITNLKVSSTLDGSEFSNHDVDWLKNPNGPQYQ
jgi:hypothetical protein